MRKFYEVSKVLDKRTDSHGRVQYLVRWRGYGKKNDSWVDEADTNERLKQSCLLAKINFMHKRVNRTRGPVYRKTRSFYRPWKPYW